MDDKMLLSIVLLIMLDFDCRGGLRERLQAFLWAWGMV